MSCKTGVDGTRCCDVTRRWRDCRDRQACARELSGDCYYDEGKPCLQRDVSKEDVSRRGAGKIMLDVCLLPVVAQVTQRVHTNHTRSNSTPSCVLWIIARTTLRGSLLRTPRTVAEQSVALPELILGRTSWRLFKSCLRDWSTSRTRRCKQDRDREQRNARWVQLNSVSRRCSQEVVRPAGRRESSIYARLAWQCTFKACACAAHPKMKEVFDLATQKGTHPVANNDMSQKLQSLSTKLYNMLVMNPSTKFVPRLSVDPVACELF